MPKLGMHSGSIGALLFDDLLYPLDDLLYPLDDVLYPLFDPLLYPSPWRSRA